MAAEVRLRPYSAADEDAAIELWRRTWAQHYPQIDFNARVAWWRERWRNELLPVAKIVVAEIHTPFIPSQAGIQGQTQSAENLGAGSPLARGRTEKMLVGFVTVDPKTMYLDQIVVAPEHWGSQIAPMLLDEAKRISPRGLELMVNKDNTRALKFYEKHGFAYAGEDKNPISGKPVNRMAWRPESTSH